MAKRMSLTSQIQKLDFAYNESQRPLEAKSPPVAVSGDVTPRSSNREESLSTVYTVQNEQCTKQTVSTMDTVGNSPQNVGFRPQGNFTQIPNSLLRTAGLFEDPFDFMIYLHLYSYSFGFNRDKAYMSQAQLEAFAGVSKNRVKRALDRLIAQKWIRVVGQYEHSRVARRWQVIPPEKHGPRDGERGSTVNTPTVSKMNTYKESIQTQFQKNSLSTFSERAQAYFSELKPAGKREGEFQAFRELIGDYPEEQVWACVEHLGKNGALDGNPCFAPLAYLRKAMTEVWAMVEKYQALERTREETRERETVKRKEEREQEARESKEWAEICNAFAKAFPGEERQQEVVGELIRGLKLPFRGEGARVLAVRAWWKGLGEFERVSCLRRG